jgi:citrate lyase gamma subunit
MDEILQKLLESELLSEETRAQISEQWTTQVEAFKTQVAEETSQKVRLELTAQLTEQFTTECEALVSQVDSLVTEVLSTELKELKEDIEYYRDLEATYAERLVEEKTRLAHEVQKELDQLVDHLDSFLNQVIAEEFEELKEDMEVVKANQFGKKIYEAFADTFAKAHVDEKSSAGKLTVAEGKLADLEKRLSESEESRNKLIREAKMEKVLAPLQGKKREQMAMLLKSTDTDRLDESYNFFIGRIIKSDTQESLTEGKADDRKTTVVTGDTPGRVVDKTPAQVQLDEEMNRFLRAAGIKN